MSRVRALVLPFLLSCLSAAAGCAAPPATLGSSGSTHLPPRGDDEPGDDPSTPAKDTQSAPSQPTAPRKTGVVFVHGTGDQGDVADYACSGTGDDFHCEVKAAVEEYWLRPTID